MPKQQMNSFLIRDLVESALREDIRSGDLTTEALIPESATAQASLNFREHGIVCGMQLAIQAFQTLDNSVQTEVLYADGSPVENSATVLNIQGDARAILTGERVALNFMQRLSGIATLTSKFVEQCEGTKARIADTRKTTPGLRLLEKYAVRSGGGRNHRFALDDLILIKDNHIALCGGVESAIARAREYSGHTVKVECECDTLEQVEAATLARADIILLDNMTPETLAQAVKMIDGRAVAEASGGVNLETVGAIARSGVDIISVGALTHSARCLDIGLDIQIS